MEDTVQLRLTVNNQDMATNQATELLAMADTEHLMLAMAVTLDSKDTTLRNKAMAATHSNTAVVLAVLAVLAVTAVMAALDRIRAARVWELWLAERLSVWELA
jgi:hypothetical protein